MSLTKEEYVKECWEKHEQYIKGVEDGSIITNKWIKLLIEKYKDNLKNPKYEFKKDKAERVFKFFSLLKIDIDNQFKQFNLFPFQVFALANLFGFYYKDSDTRLYNEFLLFISRKQGKSTFISGIALYLLVLDGFINPQVFVMANTVQQASNLLNYAKSIIENSKALHKYVTNRQYHIKYKKKTNQGFMKVIAGDKTEKKAEGSNSVSVCYDEAHSYEDYSKYLSMRSGVSARKNWMISILTSAGFTIDGFLFEFVQYSKNILEGKVKDENLFPMIFQLDDDDNPDDVIITDSEETTDIRLWEKSNPALYYSKILRDDLISFYNRIKHLPHTRSEFLCKRLNLFVNEAEQGLDENIIQKCLTQPKEELEDYRGFDCYIGCDLSATKDLANLTAIVEYKGEFKVFSYFFLANKPENITRKNGINLQPWIDAGYITLSSKPHIDYKQIEDKILELQSILNIKLMFYDPHNSATIVPFLQDNSIEAEPFVQYASKFNFPIKFSEMQMEDGKVSFNQNPVLAWNYRNIVYQFDNHNNVKYIKNKGNDSIDGSVGNAMAFAAYLKDVYGEETEDQKILKEWKKDISWGDSE